MSLDYSADDEEYDWGRSVVGPTAVKYEAIREPIREPFKFTRTDYELDNGSEKSPSGTQRLRRDARGVVTTMQTTPIQGTFDYCAGNVGIVHNSKTATVNVDIHVQADLSTFHDELLPYGQACQLKTAAIPNLFRALQSGAAGSDTWRAVTDPSEYTRFKSVTEPFVEVMRSARTQPLFLWDNENAKLATTTATFDVSTCIQIHERDIDLSGATLDSYHTGY
ncbi:uncharacterized protein I303_105332 [Kwoniella dejecticola CBS 10117]|uniref:Uncharacterized protein n=1 Tax=Kwoniella dejecticola CBS 10117 TaxID=1296121 RepID=A0A1A6A2T5_9TREE|nr:uncharacterized protein I303_05221 [Kwoniella dejecticola CBS 10117]OBR84363.1 hypothetical protein I303_05221 [Kwoniella dejecticola CBS 10117]